MRSPGRPLGVVSTWQTKHPMKRAVISLFLVGCGPTVETTTSDEGQGGSQSGGLSGTTTSGAGPTASTTSASSTAGTTGPEVLPPPEGCACADPGFCGAVTPECGGEELCPAIVTDCARPSGWYGCAGQEFLYDEAALMCALDALSNRRNGWFGISISTDSPGFCGFEGCSRDVWRVRILADTENALRSYCYSVPLTESEPSNRLAPLETPAYFEACKGRPNGQAQLDCLFDGMLPSEAVAACR